MDTDTTYRPCGCGADCDYDEEFDGGPCWGQVEPEEIQLGDDDYGWLHACQGHWDMATSPGSGYRPRPE